MAFEHFRLYGEMLAEAFLTALIRETFPHLVVHTVFVSRKDRLVAELLGQRLSQPATLVLFID